MRQIFVALFAAFFLAALAMPQTVEAKNYPRVSGLSCASAVEQVGSKNVWRTYFSGARQRLSTLFGDYDYYRAAPCFTSEATCKAWLYNTQTDWSFQMDFVPCHRGLR